MKKNKWTFMLIGIVLLPIIAIIGRAVYIEIEYKEMYYQMALTYIEKEDYIPARRVLKKIIPYKNSQTLMVRVQLKIEEEDQYIQGISHAGVGNIQIALDRLRALPDDFSYENTDINKIIYDLENPLQTPFVGSYIYRGDDGNRINMDIKLIYIAKDYEFALQYERDLMDYNNIIVGEQGGTARFIDDSNVFAKTLKVRWQISGNAIDEWPEDGTRRVFIKQN